MIYLNNNNIKCLGGIKRAYLNNTLIFQSFEEYDITAKYNVTSTTEPTSLCYSSATSAFTEMYVDGVKIDAASGYTFNTTGEHTVQYMLADKTKIINNAFYRCSGLTSINIIDSVTSIGSSAFNFCTSLTSVTIPNSVTIISTKAFQNCQNLKSINIPNGLTIINDSTFYFCSSLTSVVIPDSVTRIGDDALEYCLSLTSVTIGSGVTSIGNWALEYCRSLTSITCYATKSPTLGGTYVFNDLPTNGTLHIPQGSDYSTWLSQLPSGWTIQYLT